MARARNIKPGFFTNDDLVELTFECRLFFIGLWTIADRDGRLLDRPKKIKMDIFPGDEVDCDRCLGALSSSGFIHRYEVAGVKAIQISNWNKHQKPHFKEVPSTIPAPIKVGASTDLGSVETQPSTDPTALIADSGLLIADTRYRIADSAPSGAEPARTITAGDLSKVMRSAGIQSQPADPRLIALAEQGITPEVATAACEEAKRAKPQERIGVGYVFAILEGWAAKAKTLKVEGAASPQAQGSGKFDPTAYVNRNRNKP